MTVMESTPDESPSKLAAFDIVQTDYKTVDDHGIRADFIIPKNGAAGKRPVIIRFHGGGLVTGDSIFAEWFPTWLLEIAQKHNAVIVSPNYRFLPEATSLDIFDDIDDFWLWLHGPAAVALLPTGVEMDLSRILTAGDSAGGLLSLCLALAHPDEIRSATAAYPCVNLDGPEFTTRRKAPIFGESVPESIVTEHLAQIVPGTVLSACPPPERLPFMLAATEHGYVGKFYERGLEGRKDTRRALRYPFVRLEEKGARLPPGGIVIVHGRQDSVVPVSVSERFVDRAREVFHGQPGGEKIVLSLRDGEHGFDSEVGLDEEWMHDTMRLAVEEWIRK